MPEEAADFILGHMKACQPILKATKKLLPHGKIFEDAHEKVRLILKISIYLFYFNYLQYIRLHLKLIYLIYFVYNRTGGEAIFGFEPTRC